MDNTYKIKNIVSDIPNVAVMTDSNISNSWGIVVTAADVFVTNNESNKITQYCRQNANLEKTIESVSLEPVDLVINKGPGFLISKNAITQSSSVVIATETGAIEGYNPNVDSLNTIVLLSPDDDPVNGRVFKGITMSSDYKYIFVTDFRNSVINKYDASMNLVSSFTDIALSTIGYAPFGINMIDNKLYVTFAKQDVTKRVDEPGLGNGFIDVFNMDGAFIKRFSNRQHLNSPWGMTKLCDSLLVGNSGDGKILEFSLKSGLFTGYLNLSSAKVPIQIDGLWGLFATKNYIYFAAGIDNEQHGVWGVLEREKSKKDDSFNKYRSKGKLSDDDSSYLSDSDVSSDTDFKRKFKKSQKNKDSDNYSNKSYSKSKNKKKPKDDSEELCLSSNTKYKSRNRRYN